MKQNCFYCQQESTYSPLKDLEIHKVMVFFCHICKAEYLYWSDGTLASKSLYVTINERMYRWTITTTGAQLWYIETPGEPGIRLNANMTTIKTFYSNICPIITPQNIEQKIRTLLIMS